MKFKSAQHKKDYYEWLEKQREWERMTTTTKKAVFKTRQLSPSIPENRNTTKHIPSLDLNIKGAVSSRPSLQYTGTNMIGIATMHKSNAVPVFSSQEAREVSGMRR